MGTSVTEMIGIYGGTFDPIHYGHLRTALEVKEIVGLTELRFLPCREPPHRKPPVASPELRLKMLEAAMQDAEPGFHIDTRELNRPGPSYMVDTLASLRKDIAGESLALIVGLDAFSSLPSWHRWKALFDLAHLIVMRRPGIELVFSEELSPSLQERRVHESSQLASQTSGSIFFLEVTQLEISASLIRTMIQSGRNPRFLMPDSVLHFIRVERLYSLSG
jgi:nicotinate-nucleotide adenylyltransferase